MLVLSRRKDESVVIGENVKIVVVDIRGDKVRLGIEAPSDVNVLRSEIVDKIRAASKIVKEEQAIDAEAAEAVFSVNQKPHVSSCLPEKTTSELSVNLAEEGASSKIGDGCSVG